jgi:hypothetical protein
LERWRRLVFFRWELRNIQVCGWLIECGRQIEKEALLDKKCFGQFYRRSPVPKIFGIPVGKKEAEKLIYSVSIIAWLGVPWLPPAAGTSASLLGLANASGKKQFGRLWPDS